MGTVTLMGKTVTWAELCELADEFYVYDDGTVDVYVWKVLHSEYGCIYECVMCELQESELVAS